MPSRIKLDGMVGNVAPKVGYSVVLLVEQVVSNVVPKVGDITVGYVVLRGGTDVLWYTASLGGGGKFCYGRGMLRLCQGLEILRYGEGESLYGQGNVVPRFGDTALWGG